MVRATRPIRGMWLPNHARYIEHIRSKKHRRNAGLTPPRLTLAPAQLLARDCASRYLRLLYIRCNNRARTGCPRTPALAPPFPA
eukprot:7492041-Lingulodinium_polyedra.AAC.1